MAKNRRRKKKTTPAKVNKKKELNIKDEVNYIIKAAKQFESKIVALRELILFSTETGDAWLLDTDDNLALLLSKEGIKQEFSIVDTQFQFGIDWKYNYVIENEKFIVVEKAGLARIIFGYPTEVIMEMIIKSKALRNQNDSL
ncbi:MAG: hypothetical protein K9H64_21600 [Bacteroidales bacterium]|nr:hypothetical protein [Bacteroidales bacterium]MCF8458663.1 hypothetical protein [Bacteroidales bacterium]